MTNSNAAPPRRPHITERVDAYFRGREPARRPGRRPSTAARQWAERTLANLESCLELGNDLEDRLAVLMHRVVLRQLEDVLFAAVWARVAEKLKKGNILIAKESGSYGSRVSFSSLDPGWEEEVRDWIMDLISEKLVDTVQRLRGKK